VAMDGVRPSIYSNVVMFLAIGIELDSPNVCIIRVFQSKAYCGSSLYCLA